MTNQSVLKKRTLYLIVGVFTMLFSGVLYAWSILKVPFSQECNFSDSSLALSFTITMCFFCLGAFLGSIICKKFGVRPTLITAGILVGTGFFLTSTITKDTLYMLFIGYALLSATGIGISYNVVVSTVCAWFPDKKGFCSGCLMMGFGISTLLLGNLISMLFSNSYIGWNKTYLILGAVITVVLIIAALILRSPTSDTVLPAPKQRRITKTDTRYQCNGCKGKRA